MPPKERVATTRSKSKGGAEDVKKKKSNVPQGAAASPPPPLPDGRELWLATDALQKTKAMRNYFQLERDRIISFWEVSKRQLEELKAALRQREQDKAEIEERHEVEKKVFKQKIRHMLYEHQLQLAEMTTEAERTLAIREEEYYEKEKSAGGEVRNVKLMQREQENEHRDMNSALTLSHDRAIAEQQQEFERKKKEMHLSFEKKARDLRDEMDQSRREEISLIEKRKEDHIAELREIHERTFREMKEYYSEITSNNLETIRTLKDEVYARKRTEAHNERAMMDVAQRNKKLTDPLSKLQRQKRELEQELINYSSDKEKLRAMKVEVREREQELSTLSWEHEVLSQRFAKLEEDRDIIMKKYNNMLQEIQQKATFRRVLIKNKLELVQSKLEGRDARLDELLRRANIDPEGISEIEHRVRDLSLEKDTMIGNLQHLVALLTERQQMIVSVYEAYLRGNEVMPVYDVAAKKKHRAVAQPNGAPKKGVEKRQAKSKVKTVINKEKKKTVEDEKPAAVEFSEPALWVERMALTSTKSLPAGLNADDDPKREEVFIQQALLSVSRGISLLEEANVPWKRPSDYYAEMFKDDVQMSRIAAAMESSKARIEALAHRRAMKEQKKYGKEVQAEVLRQRAKYKRDMGERLTEWRRKRKGNDGLRDILDDGDANEAGGGHAARRVKTAQRKSLHPGGGRESKRRPGKNARRRR